MLKDDDFERCSGNSLYFRENITCECCKQKMNRSKFKQTYKTPDGEKFLTYTSICCICRKTIRMPRKDIKFSQPADYFDGAKYIKHLEGQIR